MSERPGYDALWLTFGLSYATWLVMPRLLMHAMPDEWQAQMSKLIEEFNATFDPWDGNDVYVQFRKNGKIIPLPDWSSRHHYRHPDERLIDSMRIAQREET